MNIIKFCFVISALLVSFCTWGKAPQCDAETASLVDVARQLRDTGSADNFNRVVEHLAADGKWTPMNELTGSAGECRRAQWPKKYFKLNQALTGADRRRHGKHVTAGHFLNGADPNYSYSIFEKAIKGDATVEYELQGRSGRQLFVIVPYDKKARLKAHAVIAGKVIDVCHTDADGALYIDTAGTNLPAGASLKISVTNGGASPLAVVIINHNSRK